MAPTTSTHYIEVHYSCETFVCNELDLRARVIIGTTFSISLILNGRPILRITIDFFGSRASPFLEELLHHRNIVKIPITVTYLNSTKFCRLDRATIKFWTLVTEY